jgi:hypothetical protein
MEWIMFRVVVALLLGLAFLAGCADSPTVAPTVTAGPSVTTVKVDGGCQEDQPCWNSCTMGDQTPCDRGATLPHGQWFETNLGVSKTLTAQQCGEWTPTRVEISVHRPGGAVSTTVADDWCVPWADPFNPGNRLPWAQLYRSAAAQLR